MGMARAMARTAALQWLAAVGVACLIAAIATSGFSLGTSSRPVLLSRAARRHMVHKMRRSQGSIKQQLDEENEEEGNGEGPNAVSIIFILFRLSVRWANEWRALRSTLQGLGAPSQEHRPQRLHAVVFWRTVSLKHSLFVLTANRD